MRICIRGLLRALLQFSFIFSGEKAFGQIQDPFLSTSLPSFPNPKEIVLVLNGAAAPHGMFADFIISLGVIDYYKKNGFGGVWINMDRGFYLDPAYGRNWWNYYFSPIKIKPKHHFTPYYISITQAENIGLQTLFTMPRERGNELIKKYIKIKSEITDEVENFIVEQFADSFVLGIHYRGTDKTIIEVERVSYETVKDTIEEIIQNLPDEARDNYRLFIATDEDSFLNYIKSSFSCPIIYTNALRSTNGQAIHTIQRKSNYLKGKEALLDCLLLSRCHYLVRTESNLSHVSEFFNLTLPVRKLKTGWK